MPKKTKTKAVIQRSCVKTKIKGLTTIAMLVPKAYSFAQAMEQFGWWLFDAEKKDVKDLGDGDFVRLWNRFYKDYAECGWAKVGPWHMCEKCGKKKYPNAKMSRLRGITVMSGTCPVCRKEETLIPVSDFEYACGGKDYLWD